MVVILRYLDCHFYKFRYCIDYEDDLIVLRKIVEVLKKKKIEGSTNQIVKVLKDNSKLFKISKKNRDKYLKNRKDLN